MSFKQTSTQKSPGPDATFNIQATLKPENAESWHHITSAQYTFNSLQAAMGAMKYNIPYTREWIAIQLFPYICSLNHVV